MKKLILILLTAVAAVSCNKGNKITVEADGKDLPYRKVQKSIDDSVKIKYADKYYRQEKYTLAVGLYEDLIPTTRLTPMGATVFYRFAECHFGMKDYYLAGYYFKTFNKKYPSHKKAQEALYKSALCKVKLSPAYTLDQADTKKAIQDLQLFVDRYPNSTYTDTCYQLLKKLNLKLERKDFENARIYHHTMKYKSAVVALEHFIEEYPGSQFKEQAMFLLVESAMELGINSVESKKAERLESSLDYYRTFEKVYPESKYMDEATNLRNKANIELQNFLFLEMERSYQRAQKVEEKLKSSYLAYARGNYKSIKRLYPEQLETERVMTLIESINSEYEAALFSDIERNVEILKNATPEKKRAAYDKSIKSYRTFVAAFPESELFAKAVALKNEADKELD